MAGNNDILIGLVADIVSAYVSNNSVPASDLPNLIATTHAAITGLDSEAAAPAVEEKPTPAISIKKSITADYLICLEDGRKFKSLKRHLRTAYDMTPEQYRARWGLPADYPMVAPA
ncbi:MAG: MucR family transcriptional regulator, partial [Bosea sp. (in: a-proteobacteria)]|nr:MucR family transcriptional regulator [Bosea sp. (in: a-proteobacteria)]